ncbi:PREDICTED: uncharacterized protein LOC101816844 [Ficedula albicollis]|nr:PREDICTED: uncharacterized protein LOC101816844 [Ficedula albicollis]
MSSHRSWRAAVTRTRERKSHTTSELRVRDGGGLLVRAGPEKGEEKGKEQDSGDVCPEPRRPRSWRWDERSRAGLGLRRGQSRAGSAAARFARYFRWVDERRGGGAAAARGIPSILPLHPFPSSLPSIPPASRGVRRSAAPRRSSSLFPSAEHYKHHWFPLVPSKGSGYRCIRINHKMDPLIGKAAGMIGLSHERLFQLLPSELTLWVDPFEVSYRIGEDGSICVLYESPQPGGKAAKQLESRTSCKEEWRIGRSSPSKSFNMMTVSS